MQRLRSMRSHTTHSTRQRRSLGRGQAVWRTRHTDPGAGRRSPEELDALRRRLEQQRSELERENATLRQSEQTLLHRLDFEEFLFDLSRTFIGLTEEEVDVNMSAVTSPKMVGSMKKPLS